VAVRGRFFDPPASVRPVRDHLRTALGTRMLVKGYGMYAATSNSITQSI